MSTKDAHLYGVRRPPKPSKSSISSSTDLAFSTALTSLISASAKAPPPVRGSNGANSSNSTSRAKPVDKNDIFAVKNRNVKKRALADVQADDDPASELRWKGKDAPMDDASWKRAKRRMEEKARLYAAMKRGDVEDDGGEENPRHMVDFDRKWADQQDSGKPVSSEEDDSDDAESDEEMVEFVDEFGRSRRGTRADAAREERKKARDQRLRDEEDRYSARPKQPSNIIYGDAVQTAAFNPDESVAVQMDELAKKRDREPTPPQDLHYDANSEVRTRGTGFFQFNKDEEVRKEQMQNLENERKETERVRAEKDRDTKKQERKKALEERRKLIRDKRGQIQADRFLEGLENELIGHQTAANSGDNDT